VLKQFSRSMRPGDKVLGVQYPISNIQYPIYLCATQGKDGAISINILNTGEALSFPLQIGEYVANVDMPANSVKTIIVKL
jgi:hypothetical protein